jgi:hypothetical protein
MNKIIALRPGARFSPQALPTKVAAEQRKIRKSRKQLGHSASSPIENGCRSRPG